MNNTIELFMDNIDDYKVSLVEDPAIETNFLAFNKDKQLIKSYFANEEKQLIIGPVMIPEMRIYRKDSERGDYWVYFTKETIENIAHSFIRDDKLKAFNLQHNSDTSKVHIVESWIANDEDSRFDVPEGTWMIAAKVEDKDIWDAIKAGKFNGFSLEGTFSYKDEFSSVIEEAEKWLEENE